MECLHFKPRLSQIESRPLPELAYRGSKSGRREKSGIFFKSAILYFKDGETNCENNFCLFHCKKGVNGP